MKICTICNCDKPLVKFHRDKNRPDGRRSSCAECVNKAQQLRFANDPDKRKKQNIVSVKTWRKAHPDEWREVRRNNRNRRRAKIKNLDCGCVTVQALRDILLWLDYKCIYCGASWTDWDHMVPLSRGGKNCLTNLAPSCRSCNNKKMTQTAEEFFANLAR